MTTRLADTVVSVTQEDIEEAIISFKLEAATSDEWRNFDLLDGVWSRCSPIACALRRLRVGCTHVTQHFIYGSTEQVYLTGSGSDFQIHWRQYVQGRVADPPKPKDSVASYYRLEPCTWS